METKPKLQSKTLWVSAIAGLAGVVALFWPQAGVVTTWINANGALIASAWGLLGITLRFMTKDKIVLLD